VDVDRPSIEARVTGVLGLVAVEIVEDRAGDGRVGLAGEEVFPGDLLAGCERDADRAVARRRGLRPAGGEHFANLVRARLEIRERVLARAVRGRADLFRVELGIV